MKKVVMTIGAALTLGGALTGCGANSAEQTPNAPQNVTYNTNSTVPNSGNSYVPYYSTQQPRIMQESYTTDKSLSKQIADRAAAINGVSKAHVVTSRNNVLIGIKADRTVTNYKHLRLSVYRAVKPMANGRHVYVTTDKNYVTKITDLETRFYAGKGLREFRTDVTGIINDLTHAAKRPFENNAK
ncbi:MAG: YhcN/YlaJ family sporulation lipoprotein [Sporolactobacillus sp.]